MSIPKPHDAAYVIRTVCGGRSRRDDGKRCTIHSGFAGWPFSQDGPEFVARLSGFEPGAPLRLTQAGGWPYLLYLVSNTERAVVEYCEGDVAVTVYDNADDYAAAVAELDPDEATADDDDEDRCSCGGSLDDGEGWDGRCGPCADRAEAA